MCQSPGPEVLQEKRCKFSAPSTCNQAGETLWELQPSVLLLCEAFLEYPN